MDKNRIENYVVLIINGAVFLLLIWIYLKTYYKIENPYLKYQSGPFKGKIDIKKIKKIEMHHGIFIPTIWKAALSHKGLIITYNKYDDFYISPENKTLFLEQLLRINPEIEIISKT